jgi:hypothetical protein
VVGPEGFEQLVAVDWPYGQGLCLREEPVDLPDGRECGLAV